MTKRRTRPGVWFVALGVLAIVLTVAVAAARVPNPRPEFRDEALLLDVRYSPLHPGTYQPVTLTVRAEHPLGLSRVELRVFEYVMEGPEDQRPYEEYNNPPEPRALRRFGGLWGASAVFRGEGRTPVSIDASWTLDDGFADASFIVVEAIVRRRGAVVGKQVWGFAAGDWPFESHPVPLWVWPDGESDKSVNVAFVADTTDYGVPGGLPYSTPIDRTRFLDDVEGLLFDGIQTNNIIRPNLPLWRFYYTLSGGSVTDANAPNGEAAMRLPCTANGQPVGKARIKITPTYNTYRAIYGVNYDPVIAKWLSGTPADQDVCRWMLMVNYYVVVHEGALADWSNGVVFSTEASNPGTAVHELGHAVFGLSDENASGAYRDLAAYPNIVRSWAECDDIVGRDPDFPADQFTCQRIDMTDNDSPYTPESGALNCTMINGRDDVVDDYQFWCSRRAWWTYTKLLEENTP